MPSQKEINATYIKFIIVFTGFLTISLLGLSFILKPLIKENIERTENNIKKLTTYLDETGIPVKYKDDCKDRVLGFFHFNYKANQPPEVVICSNNLNLKNRGEVWKTLVHESIHVVQWCNGGTFSNNEEFKYMQGQLTAHSMDSYMTIHSSYAPKKYEEEVEARFYEIRFPNEIFDLYDKYCF